MQGFAERRKEETPVGKLHYCIKDGHEYLAFADRLTGWIELAYFYKPPNSNELI